MDVALPLPFHRLHGVQCLEISTISVEKQGRVSKYIFFSWKERDIYWQDALSLQILPSKNPMASQMGPGRAEQCTLWRKLDSSLVLPVLQSHKLATPVMAQCGLNVFLRKSHNVKDFQKQPQRGYKLCWSCEEPMLFLPSQHYFQTIVIIKGLNAYNSVFNAGHEAI